LANLIKKVGDVDLYRKIVELEEEIIELTRQNRQLEEKVDEQQRLLDIKGKMKWEMPFYTMDGDDVPYCPQCWEASEKTIHLRRMQENNGWFCKNCKSTFQN
jgi:transposase-like protein